MRNCLSFTIPQIKKEYYAWLSGGFEGTRDKYGVRFVDFVSYLENKFNEDNNKGLQKREAIKKTPKKTGR